MPPVFNKLPQITFLFWVMKICATTLGETAGDLLSMTFAIGYTLSSILLLSVFMFTLAAQLGTKKLHPALYWMVILSASTAGTTLSDFMNRTVGLNYILIALVLSAGLGSVLFFWRSSGNSLAVETIRTRKVEMLYWAAILFSNTLGTALGDLLSDKSGLGFSGGALLISGLIGLLALAHYKTHLSKTLLFWAAFILTRPFGTTMGDYLSKNHDKGGLGFGTIGSSVLLFSVLILLIALTMHSKQSEAQTE